MGGGWEGLQLRYSLFDYALCPPTRRVAFIELDWAAGAREQFGGPLRTAALDASVWRAAAVPVLAESLKRCVYVYRSLASPVNPCFVSCRASRISAMSWRSEVELLGFMWPQTGPSVLVKTSSIILVLCAVSCLYLRVRSLKRCAARRLEARAAALEH